MFGRETNHVVDVAIGGGASRQDKQERGVCTYGRCGKPAADGSDLCEPHLVKERKRQAKQRADARQAARDAGLCAECRERKSTTYRCAACKVRYERNKLAPRQKGNGGVTTAADRIAAATRVDSTVGNENRVRYHGRGRRGAPSQAQLQATDRQNLEWAIGEIRKALDGLLVCESPEIQGRPKSEVAAARRTALAHAALASRLIDEEVLERNRYHQQLDRMVPA